MGYRYNSPPTWPAPPSPDWVPPQGWAPDAAWGPAPEGWNFWVEDPSAPTAAPIPPPPRTTAPAAKRNWFMRHKILTGIGAFLVLMVAIGSLSDSKPDATAAAGDTSSPSASATPPAAKAAAPVAKATQKPAAPNPAATTAKPAPKPAAPASDLGKSVRDGKFAFTVTGVKCGIAKVGTNEFLTKKAQGQFCRVAVKIENIGDEAETMFSSNQYLFDSRGRKFSADDTANLYDDSSKLLFEEINPGNAIKGNIFFDVPKGTTLDKLELHDSMFSGGVKVTL